MRRTAPPWHPPSWYRRRQKQRCRSDRIEREQADIGDPTRPVNATAPPARWSAVISTARSPASQAAPSAPVRAAANRSPRPQRGGGDASDEVAQQQNRELGAPGRRILRGQKGDEP